MIIFITLNGATTLGITTLSIMTVSIRSFYLTVSIKDTQHSSALLLCLVSLCWVSHFIYYYAECHYAECRSAHLIRVTLLKNDFTYIWLLMTVNKKNICNVAFFYVISKDFICIVAVSLKNLGVNAKKIDKLFLASLFNLVYYLLFTLLPD